MFLQFSFAGQVDSLKTDQQQLNYDDSEADSIDFFEPNFKETYLKDSDFVYIQVNYEETAWQSFKNWISLQWKRFLNWLIPEAEKSGFWYILGTVLKFGSIIGLIILVVWLFIKYNPGESFLKSSQTSALNWTEDAYIIHKQDIKKLIATAKENADFRLATRYYFLQLLKELKDQNFIDYQAEKTDQSYLLELQNTTYANNFKEAMRFYEYVWYGDFEVNQAQFLKIEAHFYQLFDQLKTPAHA